MSKSGQAAFVAAFLLGAQGAWADVTPEEVWQNWQDSATSQGQKVTAESTSMDGDTLTVTGITMRMSGDAGDSSALIGEVQFKDKGDGTVAIIMPDSFPVLLMLPATKGIDGAKPSELALTVTMPAADITASGVPLALSYQSTLPTLEIAAEITEGLADPATKVIVLARLGNVTGNYLIEAAEAGKNLTEEFSAATFDLSVKSTGNPDQEMAVTLSLSGIGGKALLTGIPASGMGDMEMALNQGMTMDLNAAYGIGSFDVAGKDAGAPVKMTGALGGGSLVMALAASRLSYDATGKSVSLNFSGTDSASSDPVTFSATFANTSSKLEMTGGNWANIEDFNAALKAGLQVSGAFGLGASAFDFASGAAAGKTTMTASLGGLDSSFAMDAAQMRYDVGSKALKMTVASPDLPVPEAAFDLTELAVGFAMPLAKSDAPAPFNVLAKVVDLNVAEALWAMIDPGAALPHDPASMIIDLKGTTTLTRDLVEEGMAMAGGDSTPPGLLNSLDLPQFLLRVAGAEVTALGGFTFDNSDMVSVPGVPLPTGKIDIKAVGLNGLVDKLVAMGLVPKEQAMQGRMMLSMFANTSPDRDEITSTLEFKDKHFFANGQQLQ
jgi:Uncharacterized protein conserved in bacteria (DUF2125)